MMFGVRVEPVPKFSLCPAHQHKSKPSKSEISTRSSAGHRPATAVAAVDGGVCLSFSLRSSPRCSSRLIAPFFSQAAAMPWELTQVPGGPSPSTEQSTGDAVAATIEPKLANALVRQLNQICPLDNLRHLKRVRRQVDSEGRPELSIILCLSTGCENCMEGVPTDVQKVIDTYHLSPFIVKVAKYSATSKEEWEQQCKLWPTSYHPPNSLDCLSGYNEEELPSIYNYMKTAIQLAKLSSPDDKVANAAVIVDPSSRQVIAKATDQTQLLDASIEENKCVEVTAAMASPLSEASSFLPSECNNLSTEVSCINPWGWVKQGPGLHNPLPCESGFPWHPLRHAALVAIENAAARDRRLFPGSALSASEGSSNGDLEHRSDSEPAKRLKIDMQDQDKTLHRTSCCELSSETMRPYLCTGFDIYLVWEPCAMCAMALVHQRIKRIFYAFPNPTAGALGSVYSLHGQKSLNHHYSVYRISVPEEYLRGSSTSSTRV